MTAIRNITKLFSTAPSSINEAEKTVVFRISDGKPDRQGEIVDQKSWDFKDYMSNPLLILSHDSGDIENGVGTGEEIWYDAAEDATYAKFKIAASASAKAQTAWNLIKAGVLRTVSVGFISNETEYVGGVPVLKNNQLLETSLVLVPANPRAIALAYKSGEIHEKDARWLMDSMRKEADVLETQLKEDENVEEKSMDEVKSQISALTDAMTKLAEAQAAQVSAQAEAQKSQEEKFEALNAAVESLKPVEKAADETEDDKTDDEASDDTEATGDASDKAEDAKDDDTADKTDDVKDDESNEEEAKSDEDDAAKDGSDDQSGADADEFDEDAELTPELEAQIDEELAKATSN